MRVVIVIGAIALASVLMSARGAGANQEFQFTVQKAEAVLKQYVLRNSPWQPGNVDLRVVGFTPVALPGGPVAFRVLKPSNGVTPGTANFLLALDVAGKEQKRVWIRAEIRVFEDVVVSSAPLAARDLIYAKDLRVERRDVSSLHFRPFKRIEEVAGQQAVRTIDINAILTENAVDRPTLMRRGVPVTLLYETGSLRVETPGLTAEPGKIGDAIQVKNPTSGKLLRGIVIDERTVRVN
ncbi:MAG TPA: flagellar basal body P-ring formation chaperone FlgA [Terriglobales bacterium]|nr:flagellar basal body P-ring formation chaperone FlgA [Terriglobales bacterium]